MGEGKSEVGGHYGEGTSGTGREKWREDKCWEE